MPENILENKINKKVVFLGNEAIVRGALESGVNFVSTYPGTPSSEIGNIFFHLSRNKKYKGHFEFSTNEKVALEAGVGASFSGLKTLVAMKNFGANVALDALIPFVYTGSKGPTVIVVADDPSCHSSAQSEQNSRPLAFLAHIPILEPSDPQECKDFTKLAFQISGKFKIPVILRTTTRVAHQRSLVKLGEISPCQTRVPGAGFVEDFARFVTLPPRVLEMKKELLGKIEKIKVFSEKSEINKTSRGRASTSSTNLGAGIVSSGVSYLYVMEALKELNIDLPVLKLGFFNPLPENKIKTFIKPLKKVLIVEELEPFLEKEVERLAKQANCKLEVVGKKLLPEIGELKPEIVTSAIAKFANRKFKIQNSKAEIWQSQIRREMKAEPSTNFKIPRRRPRLCPGCPYWLVISAIKKALRLGSGQVNKKVVFGGEIGCYMLFGMPSVKMQDYLSCMGSSVGIAHGIMKSNAFSASAGKKLIAFVGDSSFFHSGIPALINTVFNKSNPLIIILDNQTTAMTGHQPHPGAPIVSEGIKIENIVKACGVKHFKVIDPVNQDEFVKTIKEFLTKQEVSVIISRRPCIQLKK